MKIDSDKIVDELLPGMLNAAKLYLDVANAKNNFTAGADQKEAAKYVYSSLLQIVDRSELNELMEKLDELEPD